MTQNQKSVTHTISAAVRDLRQYHPRRENHGEPGNGSDLPHCPGIRV